MSQTYALLCTVYVYDDNIHWNVYITPNQPIKDHSLILVVGSLVVD